MKYLIPLLLIVTSSLFGQVAVTENEPSALVEGIVNAITGDLYALEDDIIIQGAEPLRLKRSYISAKGEGNWNFFENLIAVLYPPVQMVSVNEPNGTTLTYRYDLKNIEHKKKKHKHKKKKDKHKQRQQEKYFHPLNLSEDAQGLTNTARGKISAHTNLKNQYVSMDQDDEYFTIVCPNGAKRTYKAIPDQKPQTIKNNFGKMKIYTHYFYVMQSEELPSGNKIVYDWHKGQLQSIRTTDPSGQKTYAQATFHYHGKIKEKHDQSYWNTIDFDINTSDGRTLQYRHFCDGKPEKQGTWYLHQVVSSDFPSETIHYYGQEDYRKRILAAIALPNSRNLHVGYHNNPNDPICSRVQVLSAPVGKDNTPLVTHQFDYNLSQQMSGVTDIEGIPTHYYWDENLRLSRIDRFTTALTLYCSTLFAWGSNQGPDAANLICKAFSDEHRSPLHATTCSYDGRGNLLLEKFYGNLTGQGIPLALDPHHLPIENGVETYTKKFDYSQDGRNLLLRKEEDSGLVVTYDYLAGTDLPLSELSYENGHIKRRKFYEYNGDRILVREITDDGVTPDKNNLSGIKIRLIQQIHPKPDSPFLGMPQTIEERYWNGQSEKLLKKTILHYTTGGRIERKEIYDADEKFCYSLTYKYDGKGNLREETNAIGQTAISDYDELGNKKFFHDFSGRTHAEMNYDYSNRLIESKEVGDDGCVRITRHDYDKKHNRILTIDSHGYQTHYVYDSLNRLKETHLPATETLHPVICSNYDAAGREITHTDPKGHVTTTVYNAYGKPVSIDHPDETQERFTYHLNGNLHTHIDQNGVETSYTYDTFDRPTSITKTFQGETLSQEIFTYDAFHLIAKTDGEGNVTTYEYDGAGRKIAEELNKERIEYAYDCLGRLHSIKKDKLFVITEYDLLDRIIEERKEDLHGNTLSTLLYTYDNAGNKKTTTRYVDGKEATQLLEYDSFNRLIKKQDPLGNITTILYDDEHHRQVTIDPLGLQTIESFNSHYLTASLEKRSSQNELLFSENIDYDANDNLIAKETTLFNPNRNITTLWDYGPLDRLHILTEAAGTPEQKITKYTYTPKGQLFQTFKPSDTVLTSTYDPLGSLSSQSSSDDTINYTYSHNRLGHLLQSVDQLNKTTLNRTYDPKGRLLTEKLPSHLSFQNDYDTQGRRIRFDLPDSSFIIYDYDPLYLRKVTRYTSSGDIAYNHTYTNYDLAENLLSQELIGNLGPLIHSYDLAGRPTSTHSLYFTHEILQYDPVGNILKSRLHNETLEYTYDDLYQLISEKDHTYAYDSLYNRLQKDTVSYTINALNQIPSEFKYNPDGNPYIHGDTRYTYDALDRLISIEDTTKKLQFTYDSYHRRISKTILALENGLWKPIQTTFFLYDGQNEIGSIDATGNLQELRILGRTPQAEIGSAIAIELQGKVYVPIHDLHGNIALLISLSDQSHEKYLYTAFGEEKDSKPTQNPWRFSSKRIDDETGLVYFGRRYYTPTYGRWLTPDPLGLDAGSNLYAYVFNAPLTHVDLYGLLSIYNKEVTFNDFKQMGIGAAHGVGNFALNTASAVSALGWGLTSPFRAVNWMTGRSSFSNDWNAFQRSNTAFHEFGERWMQRALPSDVNHEAYRTVRSGVAGGLEVGTVFTGGAGVVKGAYSFVQKTFNSARNIVSMQKIARPPMQMDEIASRAMKFKGSQWRFPENPNDFLKELPRDRRGRIYTCDNIRIRPERHPLEPDEIFNPRHHGQHYHIETRRNPHGSWKKIDNIEIMKPFDYEPGSSTGFLPGEFFPGIKKE